MALFRQSLLFAVTTDPANRQLSRPHSGGWSESWWWDGDPNSQEVWQGIAGLRAAMLPPQCAVVGWRSQVYTILGNRLLPGGAASGSISSPGTFNSGVDIPQAALEVVFGVAGRSNKVRARITAIPDNCVANGEYDPTNRFTSALTAWGTYMTGGGRGWLWNRNPVPANAVVRDLSVASVRVFSLTALGALTVNAVVGAVVGQDFVILKRVKDDRGRAVRGSYRVTALVNNADGTFTYQLADYGGQVVTKPNGIARVDRLVIGNLSSLEIKRVVVRKIGRPSESYRGRRSKVYR